MTDQPEAEFWVIPTTPVKSKSLVSDEATCAYEENPELIKMLESRWNQKSAASPSSSPGRSGTPTGLTGQVMNACRQVYTTLQGGHSEAMYGKALEVEFRLKGLAYETQVHLPVYYKGAWIGYVVPDFILSLQSTGEQVVLELKSVSTDVKRYHHQLRKYKQAMPEATILCANFGPEHLNITDFAAADKPIYIELP